MREARLSIADALSDEVLEFETGQGRGVVGGLLPAPWRAINTDLLAVFHKGIAGKQMIDSHALVTTKAALTVIPPGEGLILCAALGPKAVGKTQA